MGFDTIEINLVEGCSCSSCDRGKTESTPLCSGVFQKFLGQQNFESEVKKVLKKLGLKMFMSKKILVQKNMLQKMLGPQNFGPQHFWSKEILRFKKI